MTNLLPHQERVVSEKEELDIKIKALTHFIEYNPKYLLLPSAEKKRQKRQLVFMELYSEVLCERIKNF